MIKINLLHSLRETNAPGETSSEGGSPLKGFLNKFLTAFRPKGVSEEGVESEEEAINPAGIAVKLVLMLGGIGGLFYYESVNIPRLQGDLDAKNQSLQELIDYNQKAASAVAEIKRQEELKIQIEKQIESLDGLSRVRMKYIKALDLIQTNLPDKMWFVSLRSRDNVIEASGLSLGESEITHFLDVMGRSAYFSDVSLLSSEDVKGRDSDKTFKRFNLNFVLEGGK